MSTPPTVYIVDDDDAVRDSLALLLALRGFATRTFASAEDFLAFCSHDHSGCLILDLRMEGISGLELQAELARRSLHIPIVFVTAHGDVTAARTALRAGAVDFIEKPIDDVQLDQAIRLALDRDRTNRQQQALIEQAGRLYERLTAREREVIELVVAGHHNREIAGMLEISARTVEVHKARAMDKLQVERVPDLVRLLATRR